MTTDNAATWHTVVPTALGDLTVIRDAEAVTGLYFPRHWYRPSPATFGPRRDEAFAEVATELHEYLGGRRHRFTVAVRADGDPLQRRVWELIGRVPYGHTTTYGAIAARLGDVDAKQVGAAVGRNPVCILVPCHRVVASNGKLTGYAGGLARKQQLLDLERAHRPSGEDDDGTDLTLPATASLAWRDGT